jgi:hypothetical protein
LQIYLFQTRQDFIKGNASSSSFLSLAAAGGGKPACS